MKYLIYGLVDPRTLLVRFAAVRTGTKASAETRAKMSTSAVETRRKQGPRVLSEVTRTRMSDAKTGRKLPDATRTKMRESQIRRWQERNSK